MLISCEVAAFQDGCHLATKKFPIIKKAFGGKFVKRVTKQNICHSDMII